MPQYTITILHFTTVTGSPGPHMCFIVGQHRALRKEGIALKGKYSRMRIHTQASLKPICALSSLRFALQAVVKLAMSLEHNQELADQLREKGKQLPPDSHYRRALLIAAKNIETHPVIVETDKIAREIRGVGPKIVQELVKNGLKASSSKRDRSFMAGADAAMPGRKRHGATPRRSSISAAGHESNINIAHVLKARAGSTPGGVWAAMHRAARHIECWPTPLETVQQCFAVPRVSAYFAKIIVTEILRRELTGDERVYLAGAEAQMARLSGARPEHDASTSHL